MKRQIFAAITCLSILRGAFATGATDVEIVARNLRFPEGTIFVGNTLWFVDYSSSNVLRLDGDTVKVVWHQDGCGANGLVRVPDGLLVACFNSGTVERVSLDGKTIGTISRDDAGNPLVAPNDLASDAKGGVYFTASGFEGTPSGKVFYLDAHHRVKEVAAGIRFANGVVVSLDGKQLYVAESRTGRILTFAIAAGGALGEPREFVKLSNVLAGGGHQVYSPDGVRMDQHGNLFVGLYDGGGFAVLSPLGKLIAQVDLPASHHANLAIAPDGKSIYITAVDDGPGDAYRGKLYRVANPVPE
jgi:gluconolactonase